MARYIARSSRLWKQAVQKLADIAEREESVSASEFLYKMIKYKSFTSERGEALLRTMIAEGFAAVYDGRVIPAPRAVRYAKRMKKDWREVRG